MMATANWLRVKLDNYMPKTEKILNNTNFLKNLRARQIKS